MQLTDVQKMQLYENGYVQVSGVIPQVMVNEALRRINHSVGEGMPREDIAILRSQSYAPELQSSPAIVDLFHKTPVKSLLASVINLDEVRDVRSGQIALRFPAETREPRMPHPHIDGMYSPHNGVPEGTIQNFTALVGVFLSDLPHTNAGNFAVWPGTHLKYEKYFQQHGAEALLKGMPPIDMPEPVQVTGKPGDIVIAHYLLAHGITLNVSPHVRYAIFFRVRHNDINNDNWQPSMENAWMHWPGMQDIVAKHT